MLPAGAWLVASTKLGRPVHDEVCLCEVTRAEAPDFVVDPQCWWINRDTGQARSRCYCWGTLRADWRPADCCANHSANPRYRVDLRNLGAGMVASASGNDGEGFSEPPGAPHPPFAAEATYEGEFVSEAYSGTLRRAVPDVLPPYRQRWTRAEMHCDCPTPWDRDKTPKGYHCVGCCTHWVSFAASRSHVRRAPGAPLGVCVPPAAVVDVDTGAPLLRARVVGDAFVWG